MIKTKGTRSIRKVITILLLTIALVATILFSILKVIDRQAEKALLNIYDTSVMEFEAYKSNLNSLVYIYSIWDDASYNLAKSKCKMSEELKNELFTSEKYTGTVYTEAPSVKLTNVQYSLTKDLLNNTRVYYATLSVTQSGKIKSYRIVAVYANDTLLSYYTL